MPHLVHLVRNSTDPTLLDVIARQAADPTVRVSVVLLPGAGPGAGSLTGDVYRLIEDGTAGSGDQPSLDYTQLLQLIFAADSVVSW
ncbi:MAG: hypothetical protein DMD79_22580 [Candidatus Rokuibacteriota bacterium]|nr:MAG: hypothetical protein DMD79_22580 [Candidatus Rokubacteria bacterium]